GALAALALAPVGLHWLEAARAGGFRRIDEVERMLPRAQSWVYLGPGSWHYGWLTWLDAWRGLSMEDEHRVGLGAMTAAIAALGLFRERRRPAVLLAALAAVAIVLLATAWPGGVTAWRAVYALVPGAKAIRGVAR